MNPFIETEIFDRAKKKAEMMEIPLLSKGVCKGESYGSSIISLGGPAPYEYSDANYGIEEDSSYTIEGAHIIYIPPNK